MRVVTVSLLLKRTHAADQHSDHCLLCVASLLIVNQVKILCLFSIFHILCVLYKSLYRSHTLSRMRTLTSHLQLQILCPLFFRTLLDGVMAVVVSANATMPR